MPRKNPQTVPGGALKKLCPVIGNSFPLLTLRIQDAVDQPL